MANNLKPADYEEARELSDCIVPQLRKHGSDMVATYLGRTNELLAQLVASTQIGSRDCQVKTHQLASGVKKQILEADSGNRPRKVLLVVEPRTGLQDVMLSVRPDANVAVSNGPIFAAGQTHDWGIVPGSMELHAVQGPPLNSLASTLNLWVIVFY
jgi:hypothetical protein